jgi:hypothetical protein
MIKMITRRAMAMIPCDQQSEAHRAASAANRGRDNRRKISLDTCIKETIQPLLWHFANGFMNPLDG